MTDTLMALQQRLIQGYQAQLRRYDQALRIIAPTTPEAEGSAESRQSVLDLNGVLNEIAALDMALANDKAAWRLSAQHPGPELRGLLDKIAERIGGLSAIVDRRVASLQASKQALLPEVDQTIRRRKMLNAYGKSR